MACLRLFTFPPLPPLPDFNVPRFSLCIALLTLLLAAFPYFRPLDFLRLDFFLAAMLISCVLEGNFFLRVVQKSAVAACACDESPVALRLILKRVPQEGRQVPSVHIFVGCFACGVVSAGKHGDLVI